MLLSEKETKKKWKERTGDIQWDKVDSNEGEKLFWVLACRQDSKPTAL